MFLQPATNCFVKFIDSGNIYPVDFGSEPPFYIVDLDYDGLVGPSDLAVLAEQWLLDELPADIDGDDIVNMHDFTILSDNWLRDMSLAGFWQLDEESGDIASDSSGYDYDGTLNNDPVWQPTGGYIDGALSFDGTNDYVETANYKGVVGTQSRTVSAWIKTSVSGEIISWGTDSTGEKWIFRVQEDNGIAGAIRAEVAGGYIVGSTDVRDGYWHHVAAVVEDDGSPNISEARLYVDGVEEDISAVLPCGINTASGDNVKIGVHATLSRYFTGLIDDVRIYDRVLSPGEIEDLAE